MYRRATLTEHTQTDTDTLVAPYVKRTGKNAKRSVRLHGARMQVLCSIFLFPTGSNPFECFLLSSFYVSIPTQRAILHIICGWYKREEIGRSIKYFSTWLTKFDICIRHIVDAFLLRNHSFNYSVSASFIKCWFWTMKLVFR